ncbi:MAG: hypothetical protein HOV80_29685 [Polyangiaceae bacterium]|nr:hypothetical protein [Polyangiaceae bacterium]
MPILILCLGAVGLGGCAASPMVEAAEAGDFALLGREIDSAKASGELDDGAVEDVAVAVASREIEKAKGDAGEKMVLSFASCAEGLESALDDRSEQEDDVAAAASQLLLSAGLEDEDEFEDYALDNDPRPAFRALGARGLIDLDHEDLRRKLFLDLDERVRVGALKAALSVPTPGDFDALVEAARVDPNSQARSTAARALGRIGGQRSSLALKDLWLRADGRLRESVAAGWASPPTFDAGGREQLQNAAEAGGEGSVHAALLLARSSALEPNSKTARDAAMGVLVRTIKQGTREDRGLAILMTPRTDLVLEAVREAKDSGDTSIAILAHSRLIREGKADEKKKSQEKLFTLAKGDDADAPRARSELAGLGDKRVVPMLEKDLQAKNPFARAYAGRSLVSLGELPRMAKLLADKEAQVRADVACAVIAKRDQDD